MDNNESKVDVLLQPSSEPIESLGALEDVCLAALTARIWETCCWPDAPGRWTIGDYRFAIIEFEPAPDAPLYVQLWSESQESVLIEVSSGHSTPGSLKYVWRAQRKLLEQRGFMVGGAPRNFQKETVVDSPDGAEVLASETLAILFDIFGYRGEQPLTMTLRRGSRSEQRPVHASLTPEDFVKIAERHGFRVSLITGDSDFRSSRWKKDRSRRSRFSVRRSSAAISLAHSCSERASAGLRRCRPPLRPTTTSAVLSGSPWTATAVCWRKRPWSSKAASRLSGLAKLSIVGDGRCERISTR